MRDVSASVGTASYIFAMTARWPFSQHTFIFPGWIPPSGRDNGPLWPLHLRQPVGVTHSYPARGRAGRPPMFVLTFDRGLLKFNAKTPLLAPLFQFPPRYAHRLTDYNGPFPKQKAALFREALAFKCFLVPADHVADLFVVPAPDVSFVHGQRWGEALGFLILGGLIRPGCPRPSVEILV